MNRVSVLVRVVVSLAVVTMMVTGCGKSSPEAEKSGGTRQTANTVAAQTTGFSDLSASEFSISTAEQLAELAQLVNGGNDFAGKMVTLVNDVDISEYGKGAAFNDGKGWIPIGNSDNMFMGTFDGNGKKIHGLYINDTSLNDAGLFGAIQTSEGDTPDGGYDIIGGIIRDLGVVGVNITGSDNVGAVVGRIGRELFESGECRYIDAVLGRVDACYSSGTVSGGNGVGGIVGTLSNGTVTGSYNTATVSGKNNIGGVVGIVGTSECDGYRRIERGTQTSSVTHCYSTGNVSGDDRIGGVVGYIAGGIVTGSYSSAAVSGNDNVGGVVGVVASPGELSYGPELYMPCYNECFGTYSDNNSDGDCEAQCQLTFVYPAIPCTITNSAALNPSVKGRRSGRVVGKTTGEDVTLTNNAAFAGLKDRGDRTDRWVVKGPETTDGADITTAEIASDPTLGGRFKEGWTTEKGKLPGLGGKAVDMPAHLR